MRAGFGLVSLLMVVAIVFWLIGGPSNGCSGRSYIQTVTDVKKEQEPRAQQWGGKDPQGRPFHESLTLSDWPQRGPLKGLMVSSVDPAGVAATHFGLQPGDVILEIGLQPVGGPIIDSVGAGNDFLTDAFAKSFPIKVRRGQEELTLPDPSAAGAATPGNPAGAPAGSGGPAGVLQNLPGGASVPGGGR